MGQQKLKETPSREIKKCTVTHRRSRDLRSEPDDGLKLQTMTRMDMEGEEPNSHRG